jgi:hypothetical protein
MFDKARLYQIGDQLFDDAKRYLVTHNQEENDEAAKDYRYRFPHAPAQRD